MDEIYETISGDNEFLDQETFNSEIQQFFSGKSIFLTGCTGFIGKCLVEKILRSCPDIKMLYIVARAKKHTLIDKRMEEYFDNVIFDKLRKLRPNFKKQVTIIEGDLSMPGMAISPENRQLLIETVDLIIHNAAMVIFSAKVSTLLSTNVLGTKEMLDLAEECHHLKCFMYVSTAYSHCYLKTIEEKFYDSPANLQMVRDMIKADLDNEAGLSKEALNEILGPYPNVYIFTKAVAESIVEEYAKKASYACGVFRMSIVISTYKEPISSWCGNVNGPTFCFLSIGMGILHAMYIAGDGSPALIPADMTANAVLVTIWDVVENKKDCKEASIYNYGLSTTNPITYQMLQNKLEMYGKDAPTIKAVWKYFVVLSLSYRQFVINNILFHLIPAILADAGCLLRRKKMKYIPLLLKVDKHRAELLYFSTHNWDLKMGQMLRIWERMNPVDRKLFFCDLREIDWDEYSFSYWRGLRVYILKDPMDTLNVARRKNQRLIWMHNSLVFLIILFIGYVVFRIVSPFFV